LNAANRRVIKLNDAAGLKEASPVLRGAALETKREEAAGGTLSIILPMPDENNGYLVD